MAVRKAILRHLPLATRLKCSLVSKAWAETLRKPALWADLAFEGACASHLDNRALLSICRRASGHLRSLDLSHPACSRLTLYLDGAPLFSLLAAEGLTSRLESLSTTGGSPFTIGDAAGARQLLAACPALTSTAVTVDGPWRDAAAAMLALPGSRRGCSVTFQSPPTGQGDPDFSAFAVALCAGLSHCAVERLVFHERGVRRPGAAPSARAAAAAEQEAAAQRLAKALADPSRGPAELCSYGACVLPVFTLLCEALTPESPLRRLYLHQAGNVHALTDSGGAAAEALAAALGPGRSKLETLEILGGHDAGVWCVASPSDRASKRRRVLPSPSPQGPPAGLKCLCELSHNSTPSPCPLPVPSRAAPLISAVARSEHLTRLRVEHTQGGGPEVAQALAAAVRGCVSLLDLELAGRVWGAGAAGAEVFFSGLAEGVAPPGGCALQALKMTWIPIDRDAAAALGASLRSGALPALRSLEVASAGPGTVGDALASELADALTELGSASGLRRLALGVGIGNEGAAGAQEQGAPTACEPPAESRSAAFQLCIFSLSRGAGAMELARALQEPDCPLEILDMTGGGLGGQCVIGDGTRAPAPSALRHISFVGRVVAAGCLLISSFVCARTRRCVCRWRARRGRSRLRLLSTIPPDPAGDRVARGAMDSSCRCREV